MTASFFHETWSLSKWLAPVYLFSEYIFGRYMFIFIDGRNIQEYIRDITMMSTCRYTIGYTEELKSLIVMCRERDQALHYCLRSVVSSAEHFYIVNFVHHQQMWMGAPYWSLLCTSHATRFHIFFQHKKATGKFSYVVWLLLQVLALNTHSKRKQTNNKPSTSHSRKFLEILLQLTDPCIYVYKSRNMDLQT